MNNQKFEQRMDSGSLFKNEKKTTEKQPDFTGSINVGGTKYRLSAWKKTGAKGGFLSLAVSEWKEGTQTAKPKSDGLDF